MIVIRQDYTKTDPDTPWYYQVWTAELTEYMLTEYYQTGKLEGSATTSDDGLSLTIIQMFSDQDAKNQFDTDLFLIQQRTLRDEYNSAQSISLSSVTEL